ncbi:keratin complex 2, basic, gene 7, isoform CRA_c [Rattus norvegicus]|nr:keratin complex 2, basic, gene 7, isoform CRA_c [Rattus norvegicus]
MEPVNISVVNSTGANGSRLTIGGTMGSNALSFSGGPGVLRTYSIKTTSTARRGTHH